MPIDYSKWDKLELSDDSDIEVHPNVDKRSFIRWKQQDIHAKREQRNQDIKMLQIQIPMYEELNKRVDKLLKDKTDEELTNYNDVTSYLRTNFSNAKPEGTEDDGPTFNEMIEDLFQELRDQLQKSGQSPQNGELMRKAVLDHRRKIDDVLVQHKEKLKTLLKEKELSISSDDMHTGWDRSFLNKGDTESAQATTASTESSSAKISAGSYTSAVPSSSSTATASTTTDAISTPTTSSNPGTASTAPTSEPTTSSTALQKASPQETVTNNSIDTENGLDEVLPETYKLSCIPLANKPQIKQYLKTHTHIITSSQKDALLMKAFDSQLSHDESRTKQIISYSTMIQYVLDLINFKHAKHPQEISIIIDSLFDKLFANKSTPAFEAYTQEVERTFQHIKTRCEVIAQESEQEGAHEEIQLRSLDDDSELVVNLPDPNSTDPKEQEKYEIFKTLPTDMQNALQTGSLDEVNKVFSGMPIEKAEEILEIFQACEVIGVQALLENEQDWNEIKQEYAAATNQNESTSENVEPKLEELEIQEDEPVQNTADIVD